MKHTADLMSKEQLCKEFQLCDKTIEQKLRGIEEEIGKGRYTEYDLIRNGRIKRCTYSAFFDYLKYEKRLKDKHLRKTVPPFDRDAIWECIWHMKEAI